ncbi:MAG: hypothetical protein KGM24_00520 [Elusimicrobia bacterium]|nr:hypothetical protein [Elusimicrobiota bacterium]
MRRVLLAALLLLPCACAAPAPDGGTAIQRYLENLDLGDALPDVRDVYPPAEPWPIVETTSAGIERYRIERGQAKVFPRRLSSLYLGFKHDRLVEIEAVYDQSASRRQPVEKLAGEYALIYGAPQRSDEKFWWADGRTVLRVFPTQVPLPGQGPDAVAWRTTVQIFDQRVFGFRRPR